MTLAPNGAAGTWLLDPDMLIIGPITIDFTTLPTGAVSPTEFAADGISNLYLVDDFPSGSILDAEAEELGDEGLSNSQGGSSFYPTYEDMVFVFSAPVSGVSFAFNNYGDNGISNYFTVTGGVASAPVNIGYDNGVTENVAGSGFTGARRLERRR